MQMDHLKVKQSVKSFLQWVIFVLCGLEPYLDLAGDHCTIRYAMFHSSKQKVDFLSMEQTFSCLLLTYSSYHSWHCPQPGLWLIVSCSMNNSIIKLQILQRKNLLHARMNVVAPDGNFRASRYMFLGLEVFDTANLRMTWFHVRGRHV